MLPNETNRIVWYENVGTENEPRFGEQKFIVVEGYEEFDTAEARAASGRRESRQLAVCSACCLLTRSLQNSERRCLATVPPVSRGCIQRICVQ